MSLSIGSNVKIVLLYILFFVFFMSHLIAPFSMNPWFLLLSISLTIVVIVFTFKTEPIHGVIMLIIYIIFVWFLIYPAFANRLLSAFAFHPTEAIFGISLVLTILFGCIWLYYEEKSYWENIFAVLTLIFLILTIIYGIGLGIVAHFGNMAIANWLFETKVHKLNKLQLELNVDKFRILPLEVSWRYAVDTITIPRYGIPMETATVVIRNETPMYQFFVIPAGGLNPFFLDALGFIEVDMTFAERNYTFVRKMFRCGMWNLWMWRGALERIVLTKGIWHWYIYEDISYVTKIGNEYVVVVPVAYPEIKFVGIYPYAIPRPYGVALIYPDCKVELVPMEKAVDLIKNQILIPDELATWYVDKLNWRYGLGNVWFFYKDVFEIPQPEKSFNKQPYLVMVNGSIFWFFAVVPKTGQGVYRVFLVPAHAKDVEIYYVEFKEPIIGPVRALDYVRKAYPRIDWSRFILLEPIPIQIGDTLYWRIAIVPNDYRGLALEVLVNSKTGEVIELGKTTNEIKTRLKSIITLGEVTKAIKVMNKTITKEERIKKIMKIIDEITKLLNELKKEIQAIAK